MFVWLLVMALLYSFQSLFCRMYTNARDGEGATQFSVVYSAFAGICTLAVNGFSYAPSRITVLLGLINALMLLTYNVSMVKCGTLGSYAFMMICVLSGGILVPMIYDALYLNYTFSALQIAAVLLIIAAFVVMNLDGIREKKNLKFLMWCAILFVVNGLYGVFMNLQQTLMNFTQRNEMIITTFLGMGIMTAIFELIFHGKRFIGGFRMEKRAVVPMVLSSISATFAVNMLMWVMKSVNITVLSVVNNGGVLVFSAIFAFTVFKEKMERNTLIGILMACASIVMLSV